MRHLQQANSTGANIHQLYDEFKALKQYIDSNKKVRLQVSPIPGKQNQIQSLINTPILMATPQSKRNTNKISPATRNQQSANKQQPAYQNSVSSQKPKTHQELLQQYYEHYQYSIKKVLKYKQRSSKKKARDIQQFEDQEQKDNKVDKSLARRLDFQDHTQSYSPQEVSRLSHFQASDLSSSQKLISQTLNQMVESFQNRLSQNLDCHQQRFSSISNNLQKIKATLNLRKATIQFSPNQQQAQNSMDIQEFNELMSQIDNKSVYSQTFDHPLEDI